MNCGNGERVSIKVQAYFPPDGSPPMPAQIWWDDLPYLVYIVRVQPAARRRAGGHGMRYTCCINGDRKELYYVQTDDIYQWFLEISAPGDGDPIREITPVGRIYEHPGKAYVAVLATFYPDGRPPTPDELWWEDGTQYIIDKSKCAGQAASQEAGGIGLLYHCLIKGYTKKLYYELQTLRWFVERRKEHVRAV